MSRSGSFALLLAATTTAAGCDREQDVSPERAQAPSPRAAETEAPATPGARAGGVEPVKATEAAGTERPGEAGGVAPADAPARPVTMPSQQTYSLAAITPIAESCSKPFVIMATAPNDKGPDYPWTWTRQALLANQQYRVVSGDPQAPGEVAFDLHLASDRFANAWVLVARCADGATCNYLAAMYRATVKGATAQPGCGPLPMDLSPATFKKPVLRELGNPQATLPTADDVIGMCARLHACSVAMDPSQASSVTIGFDCQKAPSRFKVACARRYPCVAVMSCLGE